MFAGLGEVVGHKDDKSQSARLAADLFLIGGAEPLYAHSPRDGLRQYLQQGEARRTTGSRIHARLGAALELLRSLERQDRHVKRAQGETVARAGDETWRRRHRGGGGGQDRTRLAIRRRMAIVRPESSQTDVNTRASRMLRSA